MIPLAQAIYLALTDPQVDAIIVIIRDTCNAAGAGIVAVWQLLSPALIGWVLYRQSVYNKASVEARSKISQKIDENTTVSVDAFDTANGHNEKIASLLAEIKELKKKQAP
jgi:hypothetical protein